ncbi:MAG TPA: PTS sugar transporter subunit IIA [Chthoniobacteraceae bacterium]|jgi:mannitol/fructose-specific phosphotransferase system IIA component (Ntr-type)|nr:PTS sugar transporter subunit IIA [Chthoniobacteraceae bacterium]
MKCILDALHEGRLIELPDNNKDKALEYLATIIEAIPDLGVEGGITEKILAREVAHNTGIGKGWACPHARSPVHADIVCSLGWSPTGIDYGAPDGEPVRMVVMYFVPDSQKNSYLKEISSLARAIQGHPEMQDLKEMTDLNDVRHKMLDAISIALESTAPEAKARMIQLEVRNAAAHAVAGAGAALPADLARSVSPVSIVVVPGGKPIVLGQDREMVQALEAAPNLVAQLAEKSRADHQGLHVLMRSLSNYAPDRVVYECLAFRS